jgi:hypothetical protein
VKSEKSSALYRTGGRLWINLRGTNITHVSKAHLKSSLHAFMVRAPYITFKNLEIRHFCDFGIFPEAHHCRFEKTVIHHGTDTIVVKGGYTTFHQVEVYGNRYGGIIFLEGKYGTVEECRLHHNVHYGISFYDGADHGVLRDSFVFDNVGGVTGEGAVRIAHNSHQVTISNNVICRNSGPALRVYSEPGTTVSGVRIEWNTIFENHFNSDNPADRGYFLIIEKTCFDGFLSDRNTFLESIDPFVRRQKQEFDTLEVWRRATGQDKHSRGVKCREELGKSTVFP